MIDFRFVINSQDGAISTGSVPLNYELEQKHIIYAEIYDQQFTGTVKVTINVNDVDDNIPRFVDQIYIGSVREDAALGTTILRDGSGDKLVVNSVSYYRPTTKQKFSNIRNLKKAKSALFQAVFAYDLQPCQIYESD